MAERIEGIHHIPPEDAAKLLGVSVERVYDLILDGVLEAKVGFFGDLLVFIYGEDEPYPTRIPAEEPGSGGAEEITADDRIPPRRHGDTEGARRDSGETDEVEDEFEEDGGLVADSGLPNADSRLPNSLPERRSLDGVAMMPLMEAAERLGVHPQRVRRLVRDGRINGRKESGRWWLLCDEVEAYARDQAWWRDMGGKWTPYGRLPRVERKGPKMVRPASGEADEVPAPVAGAPELLHDGWISTRDAAALFGVGVNRLYVIAMENGFRRFFSRRAEGTRRKDHRSGNLPCWYSLSDVLRVAAEREAHSWRRTFTPKEWREGPTRKPFIRARIEAPPGDRLIRVPEAAEILKFRGHGCRRWLRVGSSSDGSGIRGSRAVRYG